MKLSASRLLSFASVLAAVAHASLEWKTHDISSLLVEEDDKHVSYYTSDGTKENLETLLAASGTNNIKIRLWVDPEDGTYGTEYGLKIAKRAKAAGLSVTLNLHYSDTWASPAAQTVPAAWKNYGIDELVDAVKSYTQNVTEQFNAVSDVVLVGIGNEIRAGLLWPLGEEPNYGNIAEILTAASAGVKAVSKNIQVMTHLDNGYDSSAQTYFYEQLVANGFDMSAIDVQGVSFYPFYSTESTFDNFKTAMSDLRAKYTKKLAVVETDWPFKCSDTSEFGAELTTDFAFGAAGQTKWVDAIATTLEEVEGAAGIMYWEPGWIDNAALGSSCSDNVLFEGDWSDPSAVKATARSSLDMFGSL